MRDHDVGPPAHRHSLRTGDCDCNCTCTCTAFARWIHNDMPALVQEETLAETANDAMGLTLAAQSEQHSYAPLQP